MKPSSVATFAACLVVTTIALSTALAGQEPGSGPVIVVETSKGRFAFETFAREAPLTVDHVLALVRRGFYDGQRVHRAVPSFVVQFGDPQTRAAEQRGIWGRGSGAASGNPVGVVEFHRSRRHARGAVGLAHMGDPSEADSQIYITLADREDLDGRYVVFGQVVSGFEVPAQLGVGDDILRVYVQE